MQQQCPELGEVRGLGLMTAVDWSSPAIVRFITRRCAEDVIQTAFHQGLLLLGCGERAIRFCPPLCIAAEQVETALEILTGILPERQAVRTGRRV